MVRLLRHLFSPPTLYWVRTDLCVLAALTRQTLTGRRAAQVKPRARYLNLGCGPAAVPSRDWLNSDALPAPGVDFLVRAGWPLPFARGRFEGVYAEHIFEHLTPAQAAVFLAEARRVLCPAGTLRLSVPDAELYLRAYLERHEWLRGQRGGQHATAIQVLNNVFRQGQEHQFAYDAETLPS